MKISEQFLTQNDCYKTGKTITVKGLMLHSIGCPQPKASVFINQWNKSGVDKCVHAFIQADGNVYQTLPWNRRGWHCGSGGKGSGNATHIGVEMTEPSTIKYTSGSNFTDTNPKETKEYITETYKTAVELFAYLCKKYNLDPIKDGVIISHSEGCKREIASNHGDVEHIWHKYGLTMAQFRKDVKSAMSGSSTATKENTGSFKPYKVKITSDVLNVRKGPGTDYEVVTTTKKGETFTIVEEKKDGNTTWGKLKSGAGYISLEYATKC